MRRWRAAVAILIVSVWGWGCSGDNNDGAPAEPMVDMAEVAQDMPEGEDQPAPADMGEEVDMPPPDMKPEVCPEAERCPRGYSFNDLCQCRAPIDRACETDADCRANETCQSFPIGDTGREDLVCILDEAQLTVTACPGAAGCEDADGDLLAAAVSKIVTPQGFETPKPAGLEDGGESAYMNFAPPIADQTKWNDCGYDGLCPGDEGYTEADEGELDGQLQGMFIAGFRHGRPAQYCPEELIGCDEPECCVSKYAHDDIRVQIAVVRKGGTTVAFAVLDSVGYFHTYIDEIRAKVQAQADVDLLIMAASHSHEGPDTVGQWGPGSTAPVTDGRDPRLMRDIQEKTVAGITEAIDQLVPADVEAAVLNVGVDGLAMSDSRPPYLFDDNVPVVRFTEQGSGAPIATMLSVPNHAEVLWSGNKYVTSDYFHYTRKYVADGLDAVTDANGDEVKPALEGLGGVTVVFAGAVGGLINPGDAVAKDYAGEVFDEDTFAKADAVGQRFAMHVLEAKRDGGFTPITERDLRFATKRFLTPITNSVFILAGFVLEVFERDIYNAKKTGLTSFRPNQPKVMSQVAVVRLGPISFFTAPGEVFPETLTGGYPNRSSVQTPVIGDAEERKTPATCDEQGLPLPDPEVGTTPCIVRPDQENPPPWEMAPQGPYVYEIIPGEYPFFIGLGMDFLGYMVPEYDYEPDDAPGRHYEETNGASKEIIGDWRASLEEVLDAVVD